MSYFQLPLKIWDDLYKYDWIEGESNFFIKERLLCSLGQICLLGPPASGKKHIAYQISQITDHKLFIPNHMKDIEILDHYEINLREKKNAIWIVSDLSLFSKDSISRFKSMLQIEIQELSNDMFEKLLVARLERFGYALDLDIIRYILLRLNRSYFDVDRIVDFISKEGRCNLISLKKFFS